MKKMTETEHIALHPRRPARHPGTFRVSTESDIPEKAHTGAICYVESPTTWRGNNAKLRFDGLEWVFLQCGENAGKSYVYRGSVDTLGELDTDEMKAKAQPGDTWHCEESGKFVYWNDIQESWYEVNLPEIMRMFKNETGMSIEEWSKKED